MRSLLFLILLLSLSAVVQGKTVVQDTTDIITDPFKIGEASENIARSVDQIVDGLDRTLLNIKEIQSETDEDIRDYLSQVDSMVESFNETVTTAGKQMETSLAVLANEVKELENQVYKDAIDLIWRAQCAATVLIEETAKKALADMLNKLKESKPKIIVFGMTIGEAEIGEMDILDPDLVYRAVKQNRLKFLNDTLTKHSDAYSIKSTYLNLSRLAKLTQCHYIGQGLEMDFIRERYEFERLAAPWHFVKL